jgi:mRNA interferase RelE/StbE
VYAVSLARRAQKDLDKLPGQLFERLLEALAALGEDPRPHGCEKLHGPEDGFRIRAGDYRILYDIDEARHEVLVLRVKHRREAYRES